MTKLSRTMAHAKLTAEIDGYVRVGSRRYGGYSSATVVALIRRDILREADRYGHYRLATTRDEDHVRVMGRHIGTFRDSCASWGCTGCPQD